MKTFLHVHCLSCGSILGLLLMQALPLPLSAADGHGHARGLEGSVSDTSIPMDHAADAEWADLLAGRCSDGRRNVPGGRDNAGGGVSETLSSAEASQYDQCNQNLERARRFRKFRENHAGSKWDCKSKREEARCLLQAGYTGDETEELRRNQLVAELRGDERLSAEEQSALVASAENLKVVRRRLKPGPERMAAFESVARELIREFPTVEMPYVSLIQIARHSPHERAVAIYADLLASNAPVHLKKMVERLRSREALVGQSLATLLGDATHGTEAFRSVPGKNLVLYTWSANSPASLELARAAGSLAPLNSVVVGVNVDGESKSAAMVAESRGLPGEQLYVAQGDMNALASSLLLDEPAMIYLGDTRGVLLSVSAQFGVPSSFAVLTAPNP